MFFVKCHNLKMASIFTTSDSQAVTNLDIRKIRQNPLAVMINDYTLQSGVVYKNKEVLENPTYCHKFIVSRTHLQTWQSQFRFDSR